MADPEFLRRGRQSQIGGANLLFDIIFFTENCMKMKKMNGGHVFFMST